MAKAGEERALRQSIVDNCRKMNAMGINQGTSGNISVRWRDGLLISPTGVSYETMEIDDVVFMQFDGSFKGDVLPSSEWRFHSGILKTRPEVNSVVHTHSPYCTTIAIKELEIPPLHYMIAVSGGDTIRCAPYATWGTQELADLALEALQGRTACLLANHGMIATGPNVTRAMWLAIEVETLARQYFNTLLIGGPNLLSSEEVGRVIEKFRSYGQQKQ